MDNKNNDEPVLTIEESEEDGQIQSMHEAIAKQFQQDAIHLFRLQIYIKMFDPKEHRNLSDLNVLFNIYLLRRDAPDFLREAIKNYFEESLRCDEEFKGVFDNHANIVHGKIIQSLACTDPFELDDFSKNFATDYNKKLRAENKKKQEEQAVEFVKWYDVDRLRRYLLANKELDNRHFIKNVLETHSYKPKLTVKNEAIFDQLEEEFPNFAEVIDYYKSQFRLKTITGRQRITPILLLGSPGIGKTYFVKKLAEALATGFQFIDMASASAAWTITGLHSSWKGAKQGKLFDAILNSPTANPLILLDEIEKTSTPEHDPKNAIFQILEEHGAKNFVDEFVDNPVDISGAIIIASANSLEGLSEPLQSRFKIFDIASPTHEEQRKIFQKIYKEEISQSDRFSQKLPDDVIEYLLDSSLRTAKQKIADGVGRALLDIPMDQFKKINSKKRPIEIKLEHFKSHHQETQKRKIGF
ncbi:AAA family ATPase [Ralstonia mannitolilytica]|uniref:AAA family ATPase n=1 Tax=Ralstonia mannitolilytica TaxID=105219 RepID=UPI001C95489A|nr:AAA family ATPase [Ralstonia mannitolilytica]MBY4717541.1 AAA family ATPase [Ralstonia mannitolilytica]